MAGAIPYQEPATTTILILSSFLIVLNVINYPLDCAIYCGLVGQILVGVAWGTPGGRLLSSDAETLITQLGYLGLILLVYEGGLSTSISAVKTNLFLSTGVAITGICLPIAFSFALLSLAAATPLQAFAAGAALCSTSLGTTFTVLNTSGLTKTRLGTVLTTAAMLDDVVGLIMVQVISNLGKAEEFSAVIVVRPIAVSVGLVVAMLLFCRVIIKPLAGWLRHRSKDSQATRLQPFLQSRNIAFVFHTVILMSLVAGSSYAGTSNLFAAYLAGTGISWWDDQISQPSLAKAERVEVTADGAAEGRVRTPRPPEKEFAEPSGQDAATPKISEPILKDSVPPNQKDHTSTPARSHSSGQAIFATHYAPAVTTILKPFFFASIGFSIPITHLFTAPIIWRGLVYTLLMLLGKFLTGLWLVRLPTPASPPQALPPTTPPTPYFSWISKKPNPSDGKRREKHPIQHSPPNPQSLYPPTILASAMVSRGEIGFLIASLASSAGIFGAADLARSNSTSAPIYLIVIWAIMLCTIIGPVSLGLLVRRVRKLQERQGGRVREGVMGVWGVG